MKPIGEVAATVAQSQQQLTLTLSASEERLEQAAMHAKLLLGCYRAGEANDPEVYTAAIIAILSDYPEHVQQAVTDPRRGLPSRVQWLPTPKEVKDACEAECAPSLLDRMNEWDRRAEAQLAERAAIEASHAQPRETWQETKADLERRGFEFSSKPKSDQTADQIMAKYGVSEAQWNAIPNLPVDFEVKASRKIA